MAAHPAFRMPKRVKITGRSSTITNSFVQNLIPEIAPTEAEVLEALQLLNIDPENPVCTYCGDGTTEWDHLRPLVVDKRPTGYVSEIANLVPACGKCNQSKGNRNWKDWMLGPAKLSPTSRGVADVTLRVQRLEEFEAWRAPTRIDFERVVAREHWNSYWEQREHVLDAMRRGQDIAEQIRTELRAALDEPSDS